MDMYTLLYLKRITNKGLLYSPGNSVQRYVAASMGVIFGRECVPVYIWMQPVSIHLKPSQHCLLINYIPEQNKKLKCKKKMNDITVKQWPI